jgi:hypothetical protein
MSDFPTHRDPETGSLIWPDDDAHAKVLELLPEGFWAAQFVAHELLAARNVALDGYAPAERMQADIYALKEAEARAVLMGEKPGAFLCRECELTGEDPKELAVLIIERADRDRLSILIALVEIEAQRRAAKLQIKETENAEI